MYLPSSFILRYVKAEMNVHAFMNELDQKDYWYPRKKKLWTSMYKVNGELSSHILAEFHPERATYTTLHNHFGLSKSAQTFTVGFVKLLSTHPIHIVVWGNFPFKFPNIFSCFKRVKIDKWPDFPYSFSPIDCYHVRIKLSRTVPVTAFLIVTASISKLLPSWLFIDPSDVHH